MKRSKNKIEITERDINFFNYLHSVKVATISQIGRDCYSNLADPGLYKRLLRLEKIGMLQGHISSASNGKKVYSITRNCFNNFIKKYNLKRCELKSGSIKHDLCLVEVRKTFLKSKLVNQYLTENVLQSYPIRHLGDEYEPFVRNHSDAAVEIIVDDTPLYFALELELTLKNNHRMFEKIKTYYSENGITRVLYILSSETNIKTIMEQEKQLNSKCSAKFFYTTFDKLIEKQNKTFINLDNDLIAF